MFLDCFVLSGSFDQSFICTCCSGPPSTWQNWNFLHISSILDMEGFSGEQTMILSDYYNYLSVKNMENKTFVIAFGIFNPEHGKFDSIKVVVSYTLVSGAQLRKKWEMHYRRLGTTWMGELYNVTLGFGNREQVDLVYGPHSETRSTCSLLLPCNFVSTAMITNHNILKRSAGRAPILPKHQDSAVQLLLKHAHVIIIIGCGCNIVILTIVNYNIQPWLITMCMLPAFYNHFKYQVIAVQ